MRVLWPYGFNLIGATFGKMANDWDSTISDWHSHSPDPSSFPSWLQLLRFVNPSIDPPPLLCVLLCRWISNVTKCILLLPKRYLFHICKQQKSLLPAVQEENKVFRRGLLISQCVGFWLLNMWYSLFENSTSSSQPQISRPPHCPHPSEELIGGTFD